MEEKIPKTNKIRLIILELLFNSKASHLGSSMSVVEILITAYSLLDIDKIKKKTDDRSKVFVNKRHSAFSTYTAVNAFGLIGEKGRCIYKLLEHPIVPLTLRGLIK